jgi:hypothetical protein
MAAGKLVLGSSLTMNPHIPALGADMHLPSLDILDVF